MFIDVNLQVIALEKSLKAVETTSQQQQDFAGRTIYELREEVAHLTQEASQKGELLHSLGKDRERATRDQQAKVCALTQLPFNSHTSEGIKLVLLLLVPATWDHVGVNLIGSQNNLDAAN